MKKNGKRPLVERCFGIAFRAGIFSEAPESLQQKYISIKYVSPMARAQKFDEVTAISNFVQMTMQNSQVNQEVLDNIDFDKATRFTGEALGVPAQVVRTEQEVAEIRQQRMEAEQQAMQAQLMQQAMAQQQTGEQ